MTLLQHLQQSYLDKDCAFTLRITLNNGECFNVQLYKILADGLITAAPISANVSIPVVGGTYRQELRASVDSAERRFIPLSSIAYFDVEW